MSSWKGLPLLIFGTSGISKEVRSIIDEVNRVNQVNMYDFLGYIGESDDLIGMDFDFKKVVTSDNYFGEYISKFKEIGVVIPIGTPHIKKKIYNLTSKFDNVVYPNIISPSVNIMSKSKLKLGMGNIIAAGVNITVDVEINNFNLINLNCTIGHDVKIRDFCVINPLVSISGNVEVESEVLIGAGSSIKQGLKIGKNSIVGLGAITVKDVKAETTVISRRATEI